MSETDIIC